MLGCQPKASIPPRSAVSEALRAAGVITAQEHGRPGLLPDRESRTGKRCRTGRTVSLGESGLKDEHSEHEGQQKERTERRDHRPSRYHIQVSKLSVGVNGPASWGVTVR